jgi:hypothetical protein
MPEGPFPHLRCLLVTARAGRAVLDAGGHLIMRVRAGINLPVIPGGWLPGGSRMTYLDEPGHHKVADRLPLRVAEHNVALPGTSGDVSQT